MDISWIAVSKCLGRANVCALHGSYKTVLSVASEPVGKKTVKTSTVRLSSENKTSGFSSVIQKHSGEYNALVDQIMQSTEFPQTRAERVGETKKRNPCTDARCDHSQTSGETQTVFGDLTLVRKSQGWQSPGSCRASQRSVVSGN